VTRLEGRLFLLFVALLPIFEPLFWSLGQGGPIVIAAEGVFVAAAFGWIVSLARGRASLRPTPFYLFAGAYFGAFVLSAFVSADPSASMIKLPGEAYLVAIAVLTFNVVRTHRDLRLVLLMWVAATGVVGMVGIAGVVLFYAGVRSAEINLALGHYGSLPPGNYPRVQATFANANALCTYLNISLLLLPAAHVLGWLRTRQYRLVSALAWPTALLTLSPGIGGLLLSRGLWEWGRRGENARRRRWGWWTLALGLAAAVAFFLATLVDPAASASTGELRVLGRAVAPSPRVLLWGRALQEVPAHPVFGKGVGTRLEPMWYRTASGELQSLSDPHNVWLSVLVQSGVLGLATFVALIAYVWRCTRRTAADDESAVYAKLALRSAFAGVLFFQGLSGSWENARHLWVLMGLMVSVGDER
jgi:O-antigen ligase